MEEQVPGGVAVGLALLQGGCGALVSVVTRRAAAGRLRRNGWAGIRVPSTLRSENAWQRGHLAAVPLSDLAGATFAVSGLVALVARDPAAFATVLLTGTLGATALLLGGVRRAVRAARDADG